MDIVTYLRGRASLADPCETVFIKIGLISVMEAADEIERLREVLRWIADGPRDINKTYAELFAEVKIEARAALGEDKPLEDMWDD